MKLENVLEEYGLTHREALLYLAALELGTASVQKIAAKAGLVRSTAYEVLERLREKNLVSTYLKKKVRYYSAEDPNQVVNFAETRVATLRGALPELNAITGKSRRRPTVRFYEGKEGMYAVLNEILNEGGEVLSFSSTEDLFRELPDFEEVFTKERMRLKIPTRVIARRSAKALERKSRGQEQLRQMKMIPPTYECHGIVFIWKNKVAQFSFKQDFVAVVTESAPLADMHRAFFENLWTALPN